MFQLNTFWAFRHIIEVFLAMICQVLSLAEKRAILVIPPIALRVSCRPSTRASEKRGNGVMLWDSFRNWNELYLYITDCCSNSYWSEGPSILKIWRSCPETIGQGPTDRGKFRTLITWQKNIYQHIFFAIWTTFWSLLYKIKCVRHGDWRVIKHMKRPLATHTIGGWGKQCSHAKRFSGMSDSLVLWKTKNVIHIFSSVEIWFYIKNTEYNIIFLSLIK